jgi:hypothetical protein
VNVVHGLVALGLAGLGIYSLLGGFRASSATDRCASGVCGDGASCGAACSATGGKLISIAPGPGVQPECNNQHRSSK